MACKMIKYIRISAIILIALLLILDSCYYDSEEALFPELFSECDTTGLSYNADIVPILTDYCLACHSNANAAAQGAGLQLEDYTDLSGAFNAVLGAVRHDPGFSPMPKGGGKISFCDILKLEKWNQDGKPQN